MFSIFSAFLRSSTSAAPALPMTTADVTLASSPSRSSVRERARAAWQTFIFAVVWLFIGGASRAPVDDLERAQPTPAGASVDYVPQAIILPHPIPRIIVSSPTLEFVQVEDDVEAAMDVPGPPPHPDPDVYPRVALELQDLDDDALLPWLALPIESVDDAASESEIAPELVQPLSLEIFSSSLDSLSSTYSSASIPESTALQMSDLVSAERTLGELSQMSRPEAAPMVTSQAPEPVPTLLVTSPTTPSIIRARNEKDRIALRLPLGSKMDKRVLTAPVFWPRLKMKNPIIRKAIAPGLKPKSRLAYLKHFKFKTWGGGEMHTSSPAPIPKSRSHESSLVYNHDHGLNATATAIGTLLAPNEGDISTIRSTFYSHADQSLLDYSINTSTTSLTEIEGEHQPTFVSALPTSDTSSTLADLRDPFKYDPIIKTDAFLSAGLSYTAEPKPKIPAFDSSPVVADCHDPIRYDARLGETESKGISCIRVESDRQVTQIAATSTGDKRKVDNSERCAWWVSPKSASETKKYAGETSNFPTSDTSSTMMDMSDRFRYDSNSGLPATQHTSEDRVTAPVNKEPSHGVSAYGSASTVAGPRLPFRYDYKESKHVSTETGCEKSKANDVRRGIEQAYRLVGLAFSNATSRRSGSVAPSRYSYDGDISSRANRGGVDRKGHDDKLKISNEELDSTDALKFESGLPATDSWSTISSDMIQFDASDDCEDPRDLAVKDISRKGAQDISSTDALLAELELFISEAVGSEGLVPRSGMEPAVVPSEDSNHLNSTLAPRSDNLPSNFHHNITPTSVPTISLSDKDRHSCFLPPPRIQVPNESRKPNCRSNPQSDTAKQALTAPVQNHPGSSRAPVASQSTGLSKDRVKKENISHGSFSTPAKHLAHKLPARAPLAPILPNKEKRRSTGPTESSRLKSRPRDTCFASSTEPPPMPSLPVSLRSTNRALARRGFIAPRTTSPLASPDPPKSLKQNPESTIEPVDTQKGTPDSTSKRSPTVAERRRGLVFTAGLLPSRRPTPTLDSTLIDSANAGPQGQLSATPHLGLPCIPEARGQPSDLPRGRLASKPALDTISEFATLVTIPPMTRPLDTSTSLDSIHSMDLDVMGRILDQFPALPSAGPSVPHLSSSKRQATGARPSGDPQLTLAEWWPVVPARLSGHLAPTRPLRLAKKSGLDMDASARFGGCSGLRSTDKRHPLDGRSASAHLASARTAIQESLKTHQSVSALPTSGTKPLNIPVRGRAPGLCRLGEPVDYQVSSKF